jgi:hypothetical protein
METAGLRIAEPVREVYVRFGADQDGYSLTAPMLASRTRDYETELQIPITGA